MYLRTCPGVAKKALWIPSLAAAIVERYFISIHETHEQL
jgi:hypothetical protein